MKAKYKGFTLIEITLVMVLISILIAITTPLISNVIARNDVGSAHESLYNALLRAQQLSKNQYKDSQWRVCLDNTNKQYTITSGTCSAPTNAEIIKIASNITISSTQTLDILFKSISGELDNTSKYPNTITLTGGGASKSIKINPSGVIDKEANTTSVPTTTTPSIVTDGLVLNLDAGNINSYPGLSGTGNTWFDLSGDGNNGTLVNGVGYNSANGGSLVFDGVNDYVDLGNPSSLSAIGGTSNITVSGWAYYIAYSGGAQTYSVITVKGFPWTWLLENPTNTFRFRISAGGADVNVADTSTHLLNTWYNVVGTYDGSNMRIYVNGVLKNTKAQTGTLATNTETAKIGTYQGTNYNLTGRVSNVSIYNRALTAAEIQQNFNALRGRFGL